MLKYCINCGLPSKGSVSECSCGQTFGDIDDIFIDKKNIIETKKNSPLKINKSRQIELDELSEIDSYVLESLAADIEKELFSVESEELGSHKIIEGRDFFKQ